MYSQKTHTPGVQQAAAHHITKAGKTRPAVPALQQKTAPAGAATAGVTQLFPGIAAWKKNFDREEEAIQAYKMKAIGDLKILFFQLENAKLTNNTKAKSIRNELLRTSVPKLVTAFKKFTDPASITAGDFDFIEETMTEIEAAAAMDTSRKDTAVKLPVMTYGDIAPRILSFLPLTAQVKLSGVNRYLRHLLNTRVIFRMRFFNTTETVVVTFADVSGYMQNYTLAGYHGTSTSDTPGLYKGLEERKAEKDKVYPTSQLGPGFYLTDGTGDAERRYADSVAKERIKTTKTDSIIVRVFVHLPEKEQLQLPVPAEHWADMQRNIVPPALTSMCEQPKLLTSAIVQNEHISQIKVNASVFDLVKVLPPRESIDTDYVSWLTAVLSANKFSMGMIEYGKK